MAELHVQPRRNNYWWLWLLLAIIIIGGALYYYFNYYQKNHTASYLTDTDSSYQTTANVDTTNTASTGSDSWGGINFDSPDTTYKEISNKKITTKADAQFVIYSVNNGDLFSNNKSELSKEGKESLHQILTSINQRFHSPEIKIYDQTDTTRVDSLDIQRTQSVINYLNEGSKDQGRITANHSGGQGVLPTKTNTTNIVVKR
jgi:hypothetical protein